MQATITTFDNTAEGWERSLYAFLAEKERRSGRRRVVAHDDKMVQVSWSKSEAAKNQLNGFAAP